MATARLFLEYGADLIKDEGAAALHGSFLDGDYRTAAFLAEKGARIKERDWRWKASVQALLDQAVVDPEQKTVMELTLPTWSKTNYASISYALPVVGGRVIRMLPPGYV